MDKDYAERMQEYAKRVIGYKTVELISLMIHIGDELGLYEAMSGKDSVDANSLAEATGLDERWLLEWLRGQGAAGIIDHLGAVGALDCHAITPPPDPSGKAPSGRILGSLQSSRCSPRQYGDKDFHRKRCSHPPPQE